MKKIYSLLLLAVALACLPFGVKAETLGPLYDGTNKYGANIPLEGNSADYFQRVQVIYPKSDLAAMKGKNITKMTFYLTSSASKVWGTHAVIRLAETDDDSFTTTSYKDGEWTVVYDGNALDATGSTMEVVFATPFYFSGEKNLLFELQHPEQTGSYAKATFAAKGGYDYNFSLTKVLSYGTFESITTGTQRNVRPKTLFTYEEAGSASCAKPVLTPGDVTAKTAAFSWTAGGEETQWQYVCLPATEKVNWEGVPTTTNTSATVENLAANTAYKFYLRAYCGAEDQSGDVTSSFTTLKSCYEPTNLAISDITSTGATISWAASGKGETQYQYTYGVWGGEANWESAITTGETSATLSGLNPQTAYQVWVRSHCAENDESAAITEYFATACGVVALPLNEDFSSDIDCWTMENCAGSTGISSGAFRFYYNSNPPQYLVSPELAVSEKQVKVTFQYKAQSGTYPETFQVGYSTTTNDVASAFTWSETTTATNTDYADYELIVPAGVKYIAIKYTSNNQYYLFIDNFSASEYEAPACAVPTELGASEIGINSAKLSWTKGGEETAWKLQTSTDGESWNEAVDVTENPYTLAGLTAKTKYYVRVAANCGSEVSEWSKAINFTTDCAAQDLLSESFSSTLPECWKVSKTGGDYGWEPNSSYRVSASYSMNYYATASTEYYADLTTPLVNLGDKETQLTFQLKNDAYSSQVVGEVYIVVAGVETKIYDLPSTSGFALQTVDLSAYVGKEAKFIFRAHGAGTYKNIYIDDVAIDVIPCATPTGLAAVQGNASATLTWTDENADKWNLRYRIVKAEEPYNEWIEVKDITEKTKEISGLTNGSEYEAQVQAACSATRTSDWTASVKFTPEDCPNVTSVSFGAQTYNSIVVNWATSSASNCDVRYKAGEGDWTTVSNIAETTKTLTGLTTGAIYTVQVKPSCGNADSWVAAAETYTPAYSTPANAAVASITDNGVSASWEAVADAPNGYKYIVVVKDAEPTWASATATNELSAALANLDAAVEYDFYVAAVYGEILGDAAKVSFKTVTVAPKNLTLSAVTATTATLTWEYEGAATAYEYAVGDDPDALEWNGVAEMTKILEGLTANTSYTFYVRAKYSDKVKSDSVHIAFRTECESIVVDAENPFTENFNSLTTSGSIPECWDNAEGTTTSNNYKWSYYSAGHEGACVRFESDYNAKNATNVLATPTIQLNVEATLKFWCKNAKGGAFEVKISANGGERETLLSGLTSISSWTEKEVDLSAYSGKSVVLYFCGTSNYATGGLICLDDVNITAIPACGTPKNVQATNVLCNTATITWEKGGKETAWIVEYATNEDFTEGLVEKNADATSLAIIGLTTNTKYYVRVKGDCVSATYSEVINFTPAYIAPSDVAVSEITTTSAQVDWTANSGETIWTVQYKKAADAEWTSIENVDAHPYVLTNLAAGTNYQVRVLAGEKASSTESFTTGCATITALPWNENFEGHPLNAAPACWEVIDPNNTNIYVSTGSTWFNLGTTGLFFEGAKANYGYILLPEFEVALNTLQISFSHSEEDSSKSGKIELGYYKDGEFTSLKAYDQSQKAWKAEGPFALTDVPAGARLAFGYKTNSNTYAAAIDNITIEEIPACAVPTGLAASEVTAATATLSWTSEATNFKVQYTTDKANWGEDHAVAAKTLTLEGLTEQTTYYARVKAICGEASESEYCEEISFTTPCAAKAMPYAESFEDGVPACWTSTGSWTTNSEYAHSGNALRADVKNKVATLTMPAIAISEADAELVFYVRNVYGGSSYVSGEVIITPTEGEAKHIAVINSNDINNKQKVDLSEFNGKAVVISFSISSVSSTAYVYIDDVTVAKKQCAIPTDVKASAGDSKADVEWTAGEDEEEWQVRYKATAAGEWKEIEGTITTTTYSITGLSNGTQYEVQVRAYCDETHQSEWTAPVTFTPSEPTGFEHINGGDKAVKVMKNGVLYIIRDGVQYNAQGAMVIEN